MELLHRIKNQHRILFNILVVVWGSALLAACGLVKIPLPFSPVPIVLQVSVAALVGVMLGPKRGLAASLLWLAEGAMGLPVYSGGARGLLPLIGPTGGYLLSYPLVTLVAGLLGYGQRDGARIFLATLLGSLAVFPGGLFHLSHYVGWERALALGLYPFLIGDFLKALLLATVWKQVLIRREV
ncbi:MAG: biotin transporter BioY [Parachlamydiales bacterium]